MPLKVDTLLIPRELKKTTKYTDEQKNKVRILYDKGIGIREISREIPMSRRMVQFVLFPERAELAKKNFAKRQKDGRYKYPTEVQTRMVRECRERKKGIINQLIPKK